MKHKISIAISVINFQKIRIVWIFEAPAVIIIFNDINMLSSQCSIIIKCSIFNEMLLNNEIYIFRHHAFIQHNGLDRYIKEKKKEEKKKEKVWLLTLIQTNSF